MRIEDSVALVTGANRGIGKAFVDALLRRGARKVYATARDASSLAGATAEHPGRVVALTLDVTDANQVRAAAERARDVTLLINNAGILRATGFLGGDSLEAARAEMEVNYFAPLAMVRAFRRTLAEGGGGAVVTVASIAGLVNFPAFATYSASKAAARSLIQGLRAELRPQGTLVIGVYPGPVATDMTQGLAVEKAQPLAVADAALDAVVNKTEDVFPDEMSQTLRNSLLLDPEKAEKRVAETFPAAG